MFIVPVAPPPKLMSVGVVLSRSNDADPDVMDVAILGLVIIH